MTTATVNVPAPRAASRPFKRILSIARAEVSLFLRNRTVMITGLLMAPLMALAYAPMIKTPDSPVSFATLLVKMLITWGFVFAVYYNLTVIYVTRREDGVFHRMDTGEATKWETLFAASIPSMVVVLLQVALGLGIATALDGRFPLRNPLLLLLALAGAAVVFAGLAVLTSAFSATTDSAQYTSTPILLVSFFLSGMGLPIHLFPAAVQQVAAWTPLHATNDMLSAALGTHPATGAPLTFLESFSVIGQDVACLALWAALVWYLAPRYMRFLPRR